MNLGDALMKSGNGSLPLLSQIVVWGTSLVLPNLPPVLRNLQFRSIKNREFATRLVAVRQDVRYKTVLV